MKIIAIVPAAGKGLRMDKTLPKQYLPLGGKPVIAHTLASLEKSHLIDEIILVADLDRIEYCRESIIGRYRFSKLSRIAGGGLNRQESVFNGLMQISDTSGIILTHDAARPFLDGHTLEEVIAQAYIHKAAMAALPVTDTIKKSRDGFAGHTVPREHLWAVQTPQAFELNLLVQAHKKAREENFIATDDSTLVERLGHRVKLVEGSPWNIKITTAEDLIIAEAMLRELG